MTFTESMLNDYAQPLSTTEDQHCKNAIRMVSTALQKLGFSSERSEISPLYSDTYAYAIRMKSADGYRRIKLFVQGSYANNTNVRTKSDVDIAVIQEEVFRTEYRGATSIFPQKDEDYRFSIVPRATKSFKDEVQDCLEAVFGRDVERKDKSIKVHGNTYRKDADTVPCLRYRDYRKDYNKDPENYIGGIVIYSDAGETIINYPEQHIENGREKNRNTNHHYKKMVRIIKKMRYLMIESGNAYYTSAAEGVSSFVLESLLWNIEDHWYLCNCTAYSKVYAFNQLIALLKSKKDSFGVYKEANGIKPLCPDSGAQTKLCAFIDALDSFYSYTYE